jgi:hypothetical protein
MAPDLEVERGLKRLGRTFLALKTKSWASKDLKGE